MDQDNIYYRLGESMEQIVQNLEGSDHADGFEITWEAGQNRWDVVAWQWRERGEGRHYHEHRVAAVPLDAPTVLGV